MPVCITVQLSFCVLYKYMTMTLRYEQSLTPSVLSMSLGGPCDEENGDPDNPNPNPDCAEDVLVVAVEMLVATGVVVSVAAGNEGCNACTGSPNAAPSAIVSGATDVWDNITYFSNYGQCVSVFAPGLDVISACASVLCGNEPGAYVSFSGTSMACPHATGCLLLLYFISTC